MNPLPLEMDGTHVHLASQVHEVAFVLRLVPFLSNLADLPRMNLFTYRDLGAWLL